MNPANYIRKDLAEEVVWRDKTASKDSFVVFCNLGQTEKWRLVVCVLVTVLGVVFDSCEREDQTQFKTILDVVQSLDIYVYRGCVKSADPDRASAYELMYAFFLLHPKWRN